jgi:peptidoglycan hydrolase CwlO-like protein
MGMLAKSGEMREARQMLTRSVEKIESLTNDLLAEVQTFRSTLQDAVTEDIDSNIKSISAQIDAIKEIIENRTQALERGILFLEEHEKSKFGG